MKRVAVGVLVVLCGVGGVGRAGGQERKRTPDEARKKFFGCWLEVEQAGGGQSNKDPNTLSGFQFAPDGWWQWGRRGELTAGLVAPVVRFDPTTDPMRVTFEGAAREVPDVGRRRVKLAICKFEGDRLIMTFGPWMWADPPPEGKDYPQRPRDFDSGHSVLVPSVLYGTD
jgi:hypothetical protein